MVVHIFLKVGQASIPRPHNPCTPLLYWTHPLPAVDPKVHFETGCFWDMSQRWLLFMQTRTTGHENGAERQWCTLCRLFCAFSVCENSAKQQEWALCFGLFSAFPLDQSQVFLRKCPWPTCPGNFAVCLNLTTAFAFKNCRFIPPPPT